jgi:hypothetical protein
VPDLPPEVAWPAQEGKKLPFLAQIDLARLPLGEGGLLPADGWLFAFALVSNEHLDWDPVVIHHKGPRSALARAERPDEREIWTDWMGESSYELLPLVPRLGLTIDGVRIARQLGEYVTVFATNLLGTTLNAGAAEPRAEGARLAGYLLSDVRGGEGLATDFAEWAELPGDDWMNLVAIKSVGTMEWSDSGTLHLCVRRKDLVAGDFANVFKATTPA